MRILVILGAGGHTTEMLRLVDLLGDSDYEYQYLLGKDDPLSAERIRIPGPVHLLRYPRGTLAHNAVFVLRSIQSGPSLLKLLWRSRPDAILSTGPSIALPVMMLAKLLRIAVIFVETGSRVGTVSITGRLAYRVADLYFVQWPQLQEEMPKAIYAGRLI